MNVSESSQHKKFALQLPNAAPEWQEESLLRRSRELVATCPLEGLVRLCSL